MKQIWNPKIKTYQIINEDCHNVPIVISIPHSGLFITQDMNNQLIEDVILPNSDWYLPQLYAFLKDLGLTVIINHMNRYLIDPNRDIRDSEGLSYKTNLVYKETTQGYPIYQNYPGKAEIQERIQQFYQPYHQVLFNALEEKQKYFRQVYLLDLHSFGLDYGADIILGDREGQSASKDFIDFVEKTLVKQKFQVKRNDPFAGGYITKYYGSFKNVEALQIELWYQAYIEKRFFDNEELPEINIDLFKDTQKKMFAFFQQLKLYCQ